MVGWGKGVDLVIRGRGDRGGSTPLRSGRVGILCNCFEFEKGKGSADLIYIYNAGDDVGFYILGNA